MTEKSGTKWETMTENEWRKIKWKKRNKKKRKAEKKRRNEEVKRKLG